MTTRHFSRREFFKGVIGAGVGLLAAPAFNEMFNVSGQVGPAATANPIKVGIIDPLTGPYKTSSIHDVHGANVAMDWFNSRGGVLGRPVVLLEADDAYFYGVCCDGRADLTADVEHLIKGRCC